MANNFPSSPALLLLRIALYLSLGFSSRLVFIPTASAGSADHHVVELNSLIPASTSSDSASTKGFPLIRQEPLSSRRRRRQILVSDQSRVRHLNSVTTAADQRLGEGTKVSVGWPSIGAGNYVAKVGLGTPKQDHWLILDTGSDITWIRCQPCSGNCYQRQDAIFNPSNSSTFVNATCSSPICDYHINYLDKSYSNGYFAQDTLTLSDSEQYPDFIFGCGQDNSDGFGTAAGILGVGLGNISLVSQIAPAQIFCYCLPTTEDSTGFFIFGLQALESCDTTQLVPFKRNPGWPGHFFLDFIGISIGNKRLDIPTGSGTIIDSGTVISRLPPSVYTALVAEFRQLMSGYSTADPSPPLLDVCYDLSGKNVVILPSMYLHFGGSVNVTLGALSGVRQEGRSKICLAFAANENESDLIIIGNNQQQGLRMLHNVQDGIIGFGYGGCNIS